MPSHFYPVGQPGVAWSDSERAEWHSLANNPVRSYKDDVLVELENFKEKFDVVKYGCLAQDPERYPLYVVKTRLFNIDSNCRKPCILITGGTHGYETSGVLGALMFAQQHMEKYSEQYNIAVIPCVSPWAYECIQRWNAKAIDPNRCVVVVVMLYVYVHVHVHVYVHVHVHAK